MTDTISRLNDIRVEIEKAHKFCVIEVCGYSFDDISNGSSQLVEDSQNPDFFIIALRYKDDVIERITFDVQDELCCAQAFDRFSHELAMQEAFSLSRKMGIPVVDRYSIMQYFHPVKQNTAQMRAA